MKDSQRKNEQNPPQRNIQAMLSYTDLAAEWNFER